MKLITRLAAIALIPLSINAQASGCFDFGLSVDYLNLRLHIPKPFALLARPIFEENKIVFSVDPKDSGCAFARILIEKVDEIEKADFEGLIKSGAVLSDGHQCGFDIFKLAIPDYAVVNTESIVKSLIVRNEEFSIQVSSAENKYGRAIIDGVCKSMGK